MTRQRVSGRALRAPFGLSSHPTDEELLACLDGELDGRALTRIRSHLDACWGCRGRRDRLNQTIAAFVETRLEDSTRREGFPPSAASRLSARLDEVDARSTPPPVWRRTFWRMRAALAWRPTPARFAQACVAGLTIALVVLSIGREPSVSAHELLARTVAAQEARLRPVVRPVVYQRLQVSRRGAGGRARETQQTWEIWSDTVHGRYRERVGAFAPIAYRAAPDPASCRSSGRRRQRPIAGSPATGSAAAGSAAPAAIPPRNRRPPSASSNRFSARTDCRPRGRCRRATIASGAAACAAHPIACRRRQASDDEPAALVLRTSLSGDLPERAAPMRIREAELVVRADDWHPLAQRFIVQTADDVISYELRELSFEVVALATRRAGLLRGASRDGGARGGRVSRGGGQRGRRDRRGSAGVGGVAPARRAARRAGRDRARAGVAARRGSRAGLQPGTEAGDRRRRQRHPARHRRRSARSPRRSPRNRSRTPRSLRLPRTPTSTPVEPAPDRADAR